MKILFKECQSPGYKARTMINASADVTIAIAADFSSAGEICTKNCVKAQNKLYIPIKLDNLNSIFTVKEVGDTIIQMGSAGVHINIAGNGIYSLQKYLNQQTLDYKVFWFLDQLQQYMREDVNILTSCGGGQTGIDESGAKASIKLNIPTTVTAPRNWLFRDITGKDIASEELFKVRFK